MRHGHRFRRGRRFVEQRSVCNVESRQIRNEGLKVEQCLEAALADFRLVGRIGRVPRRVLENVALDCRRHRSAVVALTDQRRQHAVLAGRFPQAIERTPFRQRFPEVDPLRLTDRLRNSRIDHCMQIGRANDGEHLGDFFRARTDVAAVREVVGIVIVGRHAASPLMQ